MIYEIHSPSTELEHIVRQIVVINSLEGIEDLLFIPNGGNFILFNRGVKGSFHSLNDDDTTPICAGYSVTKKANKVKKVVLDLKDYSILDIFPIIIVELLPVGFYKLFKQEASLSDCKYFELDKDLIEIYFKELYKHHSTEDELNYLNNALLKLYGSQNNEHLCIEDVTEKISNEYHYDVTVESLLHDFACSRSTMERQFKKIIGLTPKNFIFIMKFCKTLLSYVEDDCKFRDLTYRYSDNSHMNAVFKKFMGLTPSEILNDVKDEKIRIYQMQRADTKEIKEE